MATVPGRARTPPDPSDVLLGEPRPRAPDWYVGALIALVTIAVGILEYEYSQSPSPPGFDTAHWIWTSYGYVGLPVPPSSDVGSPYSVPPLPFLILGPVVRLFGSPLVGGMFFGGLLLGAFGLSLVHLARKYFVLGSLQIAFVGVALFNGTIFSMLFWGGYPNFLGFVLLNESLVFLLAYARSGRLLDSLLFYGTLALTFFTHDLTFVIALAACGVTALLLLVHRKIPLARLIGKPSLIGAGLLAGAVGGYFGVTRLLSVAHPGLLTTNPATWSLANVGQMFAPLVTTGQLTPTFEFAVPLALVVLLGAPVSVLVLSYVYRSKMVPARPPIPGAVESGPFRWVSSTVIVGIGWLTATMVVPAVGYLAHIDTDYLRFGYFLPVPLAFLGLAVLERLLVPWTGARRPDPNVGVGPPSNSGGVGPIAARLPRSARFRRYVSGRPFEVGLTIVVVLLVGLLVGGYSVPFAKRAEGVYTGDTHDAAFLQAMKWLRTNPQPGGVLTESKATRWIQALTARASFDYAPTWVLFYGWQIVNAQEAYAAQNGRYAITDNHVMLIYSNTTTGLIAEQPMLVELVQGVVFPMFRVQPGSELLNGTLNQSRFQVTPDHYGPKSFFTTNGTSPTAVTSYAGPPFQMVEVDQTGPGDNTWMNFSVVPTPGDTVHDLTLSLGPISSVSQFTHVGSVAGIAPDPSTNSFTWREAGPLGQVPGTVIQSVQGTWSVPVSMQLQNGSGLQFQFVNPQPQAPLNFSLHLVTSGTSNPAVTLPGTLDTLAFLDAHAIHFIAMPFSGGGANLLATYYGSQLGFVQAFQNSEWVVMEG